MQHAHGNDHELIAVTCDSVLTVEVVAIDGEIRVSIGDSSAWLTRPGAHDLADALLEALGAG
jgi:hypothetical protein